MWIGWIVVESWRFTVYGFQLAVAVAGCKIAEARCRLKNADAICGVESSDNCIPHGDGYV